MTKQIQGTETPNVEEIVEGLMQRVPNWWALAEKTADGQYVHRYVSESIEDNESKKYAGKMTVSNGLKAIVTKEIDLKKVPASNTPHNPSYDEEYSLTITASDGWCAPKEVVKFSGEECRYQIAMLYMHIVKIYESHRRNLLEKKKEEARREEQATLEKIAFLTEHP